jgi:DNA-binding LacI/PurR family transcriptional regulator
VAVVGYDDVAWTVAVRPALTVVSQPAYELGRRAVAMLVDRITGTAPHAPQIEALETRLVVRESS